MLLARSSSFAASSSGATCTTPSLSAGLGFVVQGVGLRLDIGGLGSCGRVVDGAVQVDLCRAGSFGIKVGIARWHSDVEGHIATGREVQIVVEKLAPAVNPIRQIAGVG